MDWQPIEGLIRRLEAATGPDRELDLAIINLDFRAESRWYWCDEHKTAITRNQYGTGAAGNPVCSLDEYTASIDAALTLVPEGFYWSADSRGCAIICAEHPPSEIYGDQRGHTIQAIALCIAALKARLSNQGEGQ